MSNIVSALVDKLSTKVYEQLPATITIRDLSRKTTKVLREIGDQQRAGIITYRGVPQFLLLPIEPALIHSLLLAGAPGLSGLLEDGPQAALQSARV